MKGVSKNNYLPEVLRQELAEIIEKEVGKFLELSPKKPKAIIWSGGFPRGEATYIQKRLLNDLDLFVIDPFNPFLLCLKKLEGWKKLKQGKVKVSVSLSAPYLLKNHKTLTNYELTTGKVIYGDPGIKNIIKVNSKNVSKFEGLRELFTRLLALQDTDRSKLELDHLAAKTYIACADSYLLLQNKYHPSYKEKRARAKETKMPQKLKEKALKAYEFKTSQRESVNFSIQEARKELMVCIKHYLDSYIKEGEGPCEKLKVLQKRVPKNFLLNLYFYYKLQNELNPKFSTVLFHFNMVDTYLALWHYQEGDEEKVRKIIDKFVNGAKLKDLSAFLKAAPNPSTMEIF